MLSKNPSSVSKFKPVLFALLIFFAIVPYLNTIPGDFVFDDLVMILSNENVKGETTLTQVFFDKQQMSFPGQIYRPLRDLSYRFDWVIGGGKPAAFHVTNLILHAIATLAAYWFFLLFTRNGGISFLAAVIFAVHPIHTESVAWIKGRDDLLFSNFYLLSFIMYLKFEEDNGKSFFYYIFSIFFFILSLFSKEMAITLPLAIFLYQIIFKRWKILILIPYLVTALFYFMLRTYVLGQVAQQEQWEVGFIPTMLTMVKGVSQYIRLLFLPINQCADYKSFQISLTPDLEWLTSSSLLLFIFIFIFVSRNKLILWSGLFFFVTLFPVINIVPSNFLIAERFLYLPVLGFCIIWAMSFSCFLDRKSYLICGLIVSMLIILTIQRNHVWHDEYALWTDTVKKMPNNGRARNNIGIVYANQGNLEESIAQLQTAVKLEPKDPSFHGNLAQVYYRYGMFHEAVRHYKIALSIEPNNAKFYRGVADVYYKQGMYDEAIQGYRMALQFGPQLAEVHNNIGAAYIEKGLKEEARREYIAALKIQPTYLQARKALELLGDNAIPTVPRVGTETETGYFNSQVNRRQK